MAHNNHLKCSGALTLPDENPPNVINNSGSNSCRDYVSKYPMSPSQRKLGLVSSSTTDYLAELYWKYPTVHQEIYAYPLHTNHKVLANARSMNDRLKHELEKEPTRHKLSKEEPPSATPAKSIVTLTSPKPQNTKLQNNKTPANVPGGGRRRTVNQTMVNSHRSLNITNVRKPTISRKDKNSDPVYALSEFRRNRGVKNSVAPPDGGEGGESPKGSVELVLDEATPTILDAIRIQREDVENNRITNKCCGLNNYCIRLKDSTLSERCTCIIFFTMLVVILGLCLVAIAYPIARALLIYEDDIH